MTDKRTITFPTMMGGDSRNGQIARVNVTRAPWEEAEWRPDPRHETNPRFTMIRSERRRGVQINATIATIREAHEAYL